MRRGKRPYLIDSEAQGLFLFAEGAGSPFFIRRGSQTMIRSESCSRGICMCDDLSEARVGPMEKHTGGCKDRAKWCESGDRVEKVEGILYLCSYMCMYDKK